ncbi:class I SAM-dependent methyltransferase [Pelomicrobium methylotrophicum]|nr:class I SAM-dependent methyltransferase [Pelomicrobium methylotrophicum]
MSRPLWEAMLTAAEVTEGTRLLDAGCGAGGASLLAAARGARVAGLDASPALIAIARRRLPGGDFQVGDLEALPYGEGCFDVSFAANSLMFAASPAAALGELARVTAPGGRVVIGVWGPPERCDMRHLFEAVLATRPAPPPGGGPFALSGPGVLEQLIEQVGREIIGTGEADCPFEYADFEHLWRAQCSAGPFQAAIRSVGEERLKSAVACAVAPFFRDGGAIRLDNRFRYAVAARPGPAP